MPTLICFSFRFNVFCVVVSIKTIFFIGLPNCQRIKNTQKQISIVNWAECLLLIYFNRQTKLFTFGSLVCPLAFLLMPRNSEKSLWLVLLIESNQILSLKPKRCYTNARDLCQSFYVSWSSIVIMYRWFSFRLLSLHRCVCDVLKIIWMLFFPSLELNRWLISLSKRIHKEIHWVN